MPWLVAGAVVLFFAASGMPFVSAVVIGMLAGMGYARMARLERRIGELERRPVTHESPSLPESATVAEQGSPTASPPTIAPAPRLPVEPAQSAWGAAMNPPDGGAPALTRWNTEGQGSGWTLPSPVDLERLLAGRALALAGGLALVFGVVFFLGLAFSRGWIGPEARVIAGLVAGSVAFVGGSLLVNGRQRIVGHVLLAVGLAAMNLSLFAATRLYGFVTPEIGLVGAFAAAASAAWIALRTGSQVIAAYGLVAVLAAPPVMGASPTLTTVGFLGASLIGTTTLAVLRDWRWLPPISFLLTAPQIAAFLVAGPAPIVGLAALAGFWILHVVAASGEELRRHASEPSPSSATVLLGSAGLLVWGGFTVLDGDLEALRGLFLALVAAAHAILGVIFLLREHDRHAFTLLSFGTGVAALTMAVPIQLGGPPVPIAWAAEAAALTWVAQLRRHRYSAAGAMVLGVLAIGHLVTVEFPLDSLLLGPPPEVLPGQVTVPFLSGRGAALAFVLGAGLVAGRLSRERLVRHAIGGVAVALLAYAVPFEIAEPVVRVVAWSAIAAMTAVVARRRLKLELFPTVGTAPERSAIERLPYAAAVFTAVLALGTMVDGLLPIVDLPVRLEATAALGTPVDGGTAATLAIIVALLGAGYLVDVATWWRSAQVTAAIVVAYAIPFDLPPAWAIVGWSAVAGALLLVDRRDRWIGYPYAAAGLAALAGLLLVTVVMPPDRLLVDAMSAEMRPVLNEQSLALVGLIGVLVASWWSRRDVRWTQAGLGIGAILGVYLLSVGMSDLFQAQLGAGIELEELQKQSQTALSVLWAALGGLGLAAGLVRRLLPVRLFGLSLMAVATVKVFLIDLATLDVAYRVLSFIGLGLLLLISAWTVFRLQAADVNASSTDG